MHRPRNRRHSRGPCFGQRHVLVLCASAGFAIVYCLRVNLSVALVAMVNSTAEGPEKNVSSDDCPVPPGNHSAAASTHGEKFPWSRELQGWVLSSFFWGYIVLQLPAGTLAQRYGAKWMFGIGVVWTAVLTLVTPVIARVSVYLLIAVRVLEGFGESVTFPAVMAMLGRWCPPQESSLLLSIATCGATVGTIIGQLTAGPLCSSTFLGGWPSVFYIHGAIGCLWLVPWALLVSDSPQNHPRITPEERDYIVTSIGSDQQRANTGTLPWAKILTSVSVWVYILLSAITAWVAYTLLICLPQFLSDVLHFSLTDNGITASLPYIGYGVSSVLLTWACDEVVARHWLSRTVARKLFTLLAVWGVAAALFGTTFVRCEREIVVLLLVVGFTLFGAQYAGYYANSLDIAPEYAGTIFGIGNVFGTAAGIGTPLATDAITAHGTAQEWRLVFYIAAGGSAFGGLVYLFLGSSRRRTWCKEAVLPVPQEATVADGEAGPINDARPLLDDAVSA